MERDTGGCSIFNCNCNSVPGCTAGIIGGLQEWIYKERKCWYSVRGSVGSGSCGLLEKEGAEVILYDGNDKKDAEAMKAQLGEGSKVRVVLGAFPEEEMESLDLVVMSPGCRLICRLFWL